MSHPGLNGNCSCIIVLLNMHPASLGLFSCSPQTLDKSLCRQNAVVRSQSSGLSPSPSGWRDVAFSAAPRSAEALCVWEGLRDGSDRRSPSPQRREPERRQAGGQLKARLPAVCPARCEGGEDAGIARWVSLLLAVCAASREGLEQKCAWLVHPSAGRHFTHLQPEAGRDFCCIHVPVEAAELWNQLCLCIFPYISVDSKPY